MRLRRKLINFKIIKIILDNKCQNMYNKGEKDMREFRNGKNCTEHYSSFEEMRAAWGLAPVVRRTKDENKLKTQQEKFLGICKVCKQPLSIVNNSNVLCCKNPECKGVKMTGTNEDGTEKIWFVPVTRVLDDRGFEIAMNLFE